MSVNETYLNPGIMENPFSVTKASNFTDDQISETWVDWPGPGGFDEFLSIRSPMPRMLTGGKGVGRTHAMRHYSVPVQMIRGGENPISQIRKDGILGIYAPCSSLNSTKFYEKGQSRAAWQRIFGHYADTWLAQVALASFQLVSETAPLDPLIEEKIVREVRAMSGIIHQVTNSRLADLQHDLHRIQRHIDISVNRATVDPVSPIRMPDVSAPGLLVFGIPETLKKHCSELNPVTFLYLIDEFENLFDYQQEYINSLLRDSTTGVSFMIGVRTYGLRTTYTINPDESNKRGAEIDEINLDRGYSRGTQKQLYRKFCRRVVLSRLTRLDNAINVAVNAGEDRLDEFFETVSSDDDEHSIVERHSDAQRPYFGKLERQLRTWMETRDTSENASSKIEFVVEAARVTSRPLLEKANILQIYRAWANNRSIEEVARKLLQERLPEDQAGIVPANPTQKAILSHYATDLRAQLRGYEIYAGIDAFIDMSGSSPRNLLVILKNIYRWALFNGERPFVDDPISIQAQRAGVLESAHWFYRDAKPLGIDGQDVHDAIHRLGEFMRKLRFADKLVECSLSSFSADLTACTPRARELVELARLWALLVRVEIGQKERNSGLVEEKFQLNRMLAPIWNLPIARRGVVRLSTDEINAVFDPEVSSTFNGVVERRLQRMTPPFDRQSRLSQPTLELQ